MQTPARPLPIMLHASLALVLPHAAAAAVALSNNYLKNCDGMGGRDVVKSILTLIKKKTTAKQLT